MLSLVSTLYYIFSKQSGHKKLEVFSLSSKEKEVIVIEPTQGKIDRRNSQKIERLRVAAYCRVSTDSEEQLESYQSQLQYYKDLITNNPNWEFVGIYADPAVSGTQTKHREGFQRMINDALTGKIDLILTKSISRFARNTLDTLKYVRLLKERGVAIQFEKEGINTLNSQGEMLLAILSALAQAESESISQNVSLGLKMKMKRGELIGFSGCLGYDYDPVTKTLTINEEEAEIVRYIFKRYIEGAGCYVIAKELTRLGAKTKKGNTRWHESTIRGIIKNEKYVGDVMSGKTFTIDPISKKRLQNLGEKEKYYVKDNHHGIIPREVFEKAQEILRKRSSKHSSTGRREKYSRKYAFSSLIRCGFCGAHFVRRTWHAGSPYEKAAWSCMTAIKQGKKSCPHSKSVSEKDLEAAFIDVFNLMVSKHKEIIEEFLENIREALSNTSTAKELRKIQNEVRKMEGNIDKLINLHLSGVLDKEDFERKYNELTAELDKVRAREEELQEIIRKENDLQDRINNFKKVFEGGQVLQEFDREVFEGMIEEIVVGSEEDGKVNHYTITFIFKTGLQIKKSDENKGLYSYSADDTCRECFFTN